MSLSPEEKVMASQPDHPPEMSLGANNAYFDYCDIVGWRPSYSVCLHKIAVFQANGKLPSFEACQKAISSKTCPSLKKKAEEHDAGKALYFLDRDLLQMEMIERYGATPVSRPMVKTEKLSGTQSVSASKSIKPIQKPIVTSPATELLEDFSYAAALNSAIKQAIPEKKVGMSLLDMARAQLGKTPSQPQIQGE